MGCQKATKERFENFLSVVSQLCGKIQTFTQQSLCKIAKKGVTSTLYNFCRAAPQEALGRFVVFFLIQQPKVPMDEKKNNKNASDSLWRCRHKNVQSRGNMSLEIQGVFSEIKRALSQIESCHGEISSASSASATPPDSIHRCLLESVRVDLLHYDDEKKERIIFNIGNYLSEHSHEDTELVLVMRRILEIITHYKEKKQILVSPVKPSLGTMIAKNVTFSPRKLSFEGE